MALRGAGSEPSQAQALRVALVEDLLAAGSITSPEVEAAMRAVPRDVFAPDVSVEIAYANDIVRTRFDEHGKATSSVSAPWLQATMLERAQIRPGMRCLEIGSGGYNAALMAELVGPDGAVVTVDIDEVVVDRARRFLAAAGYERVTVVHADAEDGVAEHAPFDRIVVTVGVWDVPPAWPDQLVPDGRIVLPLRMRGLKRTATFVRDGHGDGDGDGDGDGAGNGAGLVSVWHEMAGFVPMQGAGAHTEHLVALHGDDVTLWFDDDLPDSTEADVDGLRATLVGPRVEMWSGVAFAEMEPFDGLLLWLATTLDRFCQLTGSRSDAARRLVQPIAAIATPTLLGDTSFAYLAFQKIDPIPHLPGKRWFEFGAYGHGPDADDLASTMAEQIRVWDRAHRHGPAAVIAIHPASTPVNELPPGRHIRKRHTTLTITWP